MEEISPPVLPVGSHFLPKRHDSAAAAGGFIFDLFDEEPAVQQEDSLPKLARPFVEGIWPTPEEIGDFSDPMFTKHDLQTLQYNPKNTNNPKPWEGLLAEESVNPAMRELYLDQEEFEDLFGMTMLEWQGVTEPKWRVREFKQKLGLY